MFTCEDELDSLMSQVIINLHGKERYEKIIIGVDPGEVTGLIVVADGKAVDEANCLSIR
jgi:predicted RNase H-like nuclease (RuvC/YqgF family)